MEQYGFFEEEEEIDYKSFKCKECKTICHEDDERDEGDSICLTCNIELKKQEDSLHHWYKIKVNNKIWAMFKEKNTAEHYIIIIQPILVNSEIVLIEPEVN